MTTEYVLTKSVRT